MMVEAGGTEKAWDLLRGRRPEGHRRGHRRRPRGLQDLDQRVDRPPARAGRRQGRRASRRSTFEPPARLRRRRLRRGRGRRRRPPRRGRHDRRQGRAQRRHRRRHRRDPRRSCAGEFAVRRAREARSRRRSGRCTKKVDPPAHRRTRASASTAAAPPTSARCRPRSACSPTAHGSGLFQRGETQVLNVLTLGMPQMDQLLDTLGDRDQEALHAPLQHAALRQRRDRPRGRPQAPRDRPRPARRAGAAAGGALARRSSPTRCASCPRCCRPTAPPRWARCARRRCR